MGKGFSIGFPTKNKSIQEQRASLPIAALKQERVDSTYE